MRFEIFRDDLLFIKRKKRLPHLQLVRTKPDLISLLDYGVPFYPSCGL